jgi:protein tyrosine/serine phosphatase
MHAFIGSIGILFLGFPAPAAASSVPGINNFYQVDPEVYRGAQPTAEGFKYLGQLGVKIVIDLRKRDEKSAQEEQLVTAAGMRYVSVPMTGLTPPTPAETSQILAMLEDAAAGPVFVHCKRGADRTGAVIAAYRIDHEKWDNSRALQEAMADGMSRMQFKRQDFIRTFQPATTDAGSARPPAEVVSNLPHAPAQ